MNLIKFLTAATTLMLAASTAHSIAFCDLRDPTRQIYDLYPEATAYRSLVDEIDDEVKQDVSDFLPFDLHARELGMHTLYVALADEQPLGLVHVRSEASRWGLIEIVWSLGLDLKVQDFRFQRCRDSGCRTLSEGNFNALLEGKTLAELKSEFGPEDDRRHTELENAVGSHADLANAVIRSAMKTLLITDLVWGQEIAAAQ